MKMKLIVAVLLLTVAVLGCNTLRPAAEPETSESLSMGIPIAPDFRITDIPVPADFEIVREGTFVFQNPVLDVGQIRYVGKQPLTAVAQFYIDEMPRYNWKLLNIAEHESITLYYDKPEKTATVLLIAKGNRSTIIEVSFFPKSVKPASM